MGERQAIAVVTGVSKGLGSALAEALVERGFELIGAARSDPPRSLVAHPRFRFVGCDLADADAIARDLVPVLGQAAASAPARAVLINNAARAGPIGITGTLDARDVARSIAVDLAAPALLSNAFCEAFGPTVVDRRVINVSSGAAQRALPGASLYCATKAGLEMLTRVLAAEIGAPGFAAIAIRPGVIDTEMQSLMRSQPRERLPDVDLFADYHRSGRLQSAQWTAAKIVDALVLGPVESGRIYSIAEI